jgi:hypothetical protein
LSVFYFLGHGYLNDLGGYLVTQDAANFDEGISMSDLLAMANLSQSQEVVIILDCCHSGALGSIPSIPKDTSLRIETYDNRAIVVTPDVTLSVSTDHGKVG